MEENNNKECTLKLRENESYNNQVERVVEEEFTCGVCQSTIFKVG